MEVRTDTEQLGRLRRGVMELYLSDHPVDCAGCARGSCDVQRLARETGVAEVRYGLGGATHLDEAGQAGLVGLHRFAERQRARKQAQVRGAGKVVARERTAEGL